MIELIFQMLIAHAIADFALQSDVMGKYKNKNNQQTPPPGQKPMPTWIYWMTAHALIHGGVLYLITGILWVGIVEVFMHWIIDYLKCAGKTDIHMDQSFHISSKIGYVIAEAII